MDVGLRTEGTLVGSDDADSRERLRRVYDFQVEEGLNVRWLTGAEARDQEPFLAPRVTAGVLSPDDIQVDNRRLVLALIEAIRKHGGEVREDAPVAAIEPEDRKSTRLNSSHVAISYAVFCLKKKKMQSN